MFQLDSLHTDLWNRRDHSTAVRARSTRLGVKLQMLITMPVGMQILLYLEPTQRFSQGNGSIKWARERELTQEIQ